MTNNFQFPQSGISFCDVKTVSVFEETVQVFQFPQSGISFCDLQRLERADCAKELSIPSIWDFLLRHNIKSVESLFKISLSIPSIWDFLLRQTLLQLEGLLN